MARKNNDRYVRYYTFGSTAAKLEQDERRASLPKYQTPAKRKPIPFDPVAFAGSAVAILLAVLMIVGLFQVSAAAAQVQELKTQLTSLELEQQMLQERYESGYDINEIRVAAESMGMVSADEAVHVQVRIPAQTVQVQRVGWWDSFLVSLRQFFA